MSIQVALHHRTHYRYDRAVKIGPQVIRLRPTPHSRTPIESFGLNVEPADHSINWQQDAFANYQARLVFHQPSDALLVEIDLVANLSVVNPFDFFLEPDVTEIPWRYSTQLAKNLLPYLETEPLTPCLEEFLSDIDIRPRTTVDFLVDLNRLVNQRVQYVVRFEPGVQTCEHTLQQGTGSCRDSSWLLVNVLRQLGYAARFASGYLIQLAADESSANGAERSGSANDSCDLHAWAEVYLPGAGWIGLDPTSGLFTGEGHIPVACTPHPSSAAPITGSVEACESTLEHTMMVTRINERRRVTKPLTDEQWANVERVANRVEDQLSAGDVRLTMGSEPTFVAMDDAESAQWQTEALGQEKRTIANDLLRRLGDRFGDGLLLHHGQGKQYPGESVPRWALRCFWRKDREPIWCNPELFADESRNYRNSIEDAEDFLISLANRLGVDPEHRRFGYEDGDYFNRLKNQLPVNETSTNATANFDPHRSHLSAVLNRGLESPVGCCLPLQCQWWNNADWVSSDWQFRTAQMLLVPSELPMGQRLPLDSLQITELEQSFFPQDSFEASDPLSTRNDMLAKRTAYSSTSTVSVAKASRTEDASFEEPQHEFVRTAICVEPREGRLYVFMPPIDRLEPYLHLVAAIEETAAKLGIPVILEGYPPPEDSRIESFAITPDPGVLEVNIQPAKSWDELVQITKSTYEEARACGLQAEKFDLDGSHKGTGGGNHFTLGGATPSDSPLLRRPDLLRSLIGYWHNHPSLSYLFSGQFAGPTSQAPRVDESRLDAAYELEIAFQQIPDRGPCPAWLADRTFRHLLTDQTGNSHRTEFCIDKLYSPDSHYGRQGLLELRGFEMAPHYQMNLVQQLLVRSLVARFWTQPYKQPLVEWGTTLHDRFFLPFFVWQDFQQILRDAREAGLRIRRGMVSCSVRFSVSEDRGIQSAGRSFRASTSDRNLACAG